MWLFMLFAVVIIEMIVETKKENARQARVDRVMKQLRPDEIKYGYDSEKWKADLDARYPLTSPRRVDSNNGNNSSK